MVRRWVFCALGLLTLTLLTSAKAQPARPNFVFITSDDHRWDCIGAAGNAAVHTPNLDRLARDGAYFRQGTMHVPQCSPARAMLLTGLPPHRNGHYSNQYRRPDHDRPGPFTTAEGAPIPTLPALLKDAGYRTTLVGKWHLRHEPWNTGFSDVRVWMPGGGGPFLNAPLAQGSSRQVRPVEGFTNQVFGDDAVRFLEGEDTGRQPFFLWLAFTAPHLPMQPNPEPFEKRYAGKPDAELEPPAFPKGTPTRGGTWQRYYAAISHLDEQVGRVLTALESRKLAENTVVVFVGDNGYMMGSRGWNGKVQPYDESIRVPFAVRAPMLRGLRGACEAPVSSLDLPPTVLSLAKVTVPKEWAGRDLTPLLSGRSSHGIGEAVCEWADNRSPQFGHLGYRLVRTPAHKLVRWEQPDKPDELYDLKADPREQKNLAEEPSVRAVREDLLRRLTAWMERTEDPARAWKR